MARSRFVLPLALSVAASAACSLLAPRDADLIGGLVAGASGTSLVGEGAGAGAGLNGGGGAGAFSLAEAGSPDAGAPIVGGSSGSAGALLGPGTAGELGAAGQPDLAEIPRDLLILWLEGDRGVHLVDGAIDRWVDQSGNGMDAFKNIANQRPKPTPALAGRPSAVQFDGVDDDLTFAEGFSDFSAGVSIFAIANQSADADCTSIIHLSNGSEVDDIDFGRFRASSAYEVFDGDFTGVSGAFTIGEDFLLDVVHRPDQTADIRINGEFSNGDQHLALPAKVARSKNFLGRSLYGECSPFAGKIGELLLYGRALSNPEVQQVEAYLRQKWQCCGAQ